MILTPNLFHQTLATNLAGLLVPQIEQPCRSFIALFDVLLQRTTGGETVVHPNMCVVFDESILIKRGCNGAPDWVVEILSPGNIKR